MTGGDNILVIKLGALGDFVQALGPLQAIRRHHAGDRITLMTTTPYEDLARAAGLADKIMVTDRPKPSQVAKVIGLRRQLRAGGYSRVYDLQTSDRSSFYFRLFWPGPTPEWSGIARGCSHPHSNPRRDFMHTLDRQAEQLAMAGIADVPPPDLTWAEADLSRFNLPDRFAVMMPGGAPHRPDKRWPAECFTVLAGLLEDEGLQTLLIGGPEDRSLHQAIGRGRSLAGDTSLIELAALTREARIAVGNDTGPAHVAAVAGCPTVVLYSEASDPALCAQRGSDVQILQRPKLLDLTVDTVHRTVMDHLR